jgi:6-pyruvoyl-tetrahydropterin synthase
MIYGIRVDREDFNFSAAQILVMNGELEALSGHNYSLSVDISGELDRDGAIVDFRILKQWMREIVAVYNHKTLVPTKNTGLVVRNKGGRVTVSFGSQIIECPEEHCLLVPTVNTTCETLAREIALGLQGRLKEKQVKYVRLVVELQESPGQCAYVQLAEPN